VNRLRAFGAFWYDFVVGDEWSVAVGVLAAFAGAAALVRLGVNAWWLVPAAAAGLLAVSVLRAARS